MMNAVNPTAIVNIGRLIVRPDARAPMAIDDACVLWHEGAIVYAGPQTDAPRFIGAGIDAGGRLVTPGLIDAHTHLIFGGERANEFHQRGHGATYESIAASGGGIQSSVRATRAASEDELLALGLRRAQWALRCGTTALEIKSGYGLSIEDELKCLRAARRVGDALGLSVGLTALTLHAIPPEFAGNRAAFVDAALNEILPGIVAANLDVRWVDAFVEPGYFEPSDTERLALFAREHGLGLRLHVDQLTSGGGAALAARLGAVTADHLEQTGPEGIAALVAAGVAPVLLPTSVFALNKDRYPLARAMFEAGLPVVIASDFNPGSSPSPSLPFAMSLACLKMGLTPDEALAACTTHAARTLGWDKTHGALDAGYRADLVVWDAEHERELAYWVGTPLTAAVVVGGALAFSNLT